jgi:tryptophanyl-tRNA synthetase
LDYAKQSQSPARDQNASDGGIEAEAEPDNSIDAQWAQVSPSSTIRRSFSGIQPTGVPHLGNYLGALRQWKQLHDQSTNPKFSQDHFYQQYFAVVDLHALTSDVPGSERARLREESYASLLALGLNNNTHTTLFFQSDVSALFIWFTVCVAHRKWQVPQHTSLMWILSTIASTGYLSRMTQWKVCKGRSWNDRV